MSPVVEKLVAEISALTDSERQQVLLALLRRAQQEAHAAPGDEDLVAAADVIFQQLDQQESGR